MEWQVKEHLVLSVKEQVHRSGTLQPGVTLLLTDTMESSEIPMEVIPSSVCMASIFSNVDDVYTYSCDLSLLLLCACVLCFLCAVQILVDWESTTDAIFDSSVPLGWPYIDCTQGVRWCYSLALSRSVCPSPRLI